MHGLALDIWRALEGLDVRGIILAALRLEPLVQHSLDLCIEVVMAASAMVVVGARALRWPPSLQVCWSRGWRSRFQLE